MFSVSSPEDACLTVWVHDGATHLHFVAKSSSAVQPFNFSRVYPGATVPVAGVVDLLSWLSYTAAMVQGRPYVPPSSVVKMAVGAALGTVKSPTHATLKMSVQGETTRLEFGARNETGRTFFAEKSYPGRMVSLGAIADLFGWIKEAASSATGARQ